MSEPDDAELLGRIARGDRDALDVFVRRHRAPVFRYLRGIARESDWSMTKLDRVVGGISCREVLAGLSEYLDGELSSPGRAPSSRRGVAVGGPAGEGSTGLRRG